MRDAWFHGYWRYPLHRAMRFLRASLQPAWFYGFALGRLGLGVLWKAGPDATSTYRLAVGTSSVMPWEETELDGWDVAALNHYRVGGERRLFVVMIREGRAIKAEGPDEALVWAELRVKALTAIQVTP